MQSVNLKTPLKIYSSENTLHSLYPPPIQPIVMSTSNTSPVIQRKIIVGIESIKTETIKQSPVLHWILRNYARKGDVLVLVHSTKHLDADTANAAGYTIGKILPQLKLTFHSHYALLFIGIQFLFPNFYSRC